MIRFFHTADVHFGVENYGRVDAATGIHTRLLDFEKSLSICVTKAIEEKIDFFLLCGDAYKTAYPTPTQQKLLMNQLLRLYKEKIPVVIIVGNHDHPLSFGKTNALEVFGNLPVDGFHVFSKPDSIRLKTKSGLVQIIGIPWPTRHNLVVHKHHRFKNATEITSYLSQQVGNIIKHLAEQLDPTVPAILASHLTVSTGIFSGSEKCAVFGNDPVLLPSQLAISPFDYVALGHLHRYQNLNPFGGAPVVYSGSIERVDFGELKEPKGFCRVAISTEKGTDGSLKKSCDYEFEKLPIRPMIQIELTLQVGDQTQQVIDAIARHDITDAIIKIVYHVSPEGKDTVDLHAVQRACVAAHYIAGIVPVHKPVVHQRRAAVKATMDISQALDMYFTSKEFGDDEKEKLIEKGMHLYQEIINDQAGKTEKIS